MTLKVGEAFKDPGATAKDEKDGNLTKKIKTTITPGGKVDTSKAGTYTISYSVSDTAGNATTKKRTVKVIEDSGGKKEEEPEEPEPPVTPDTEE